MNNQGQRTFTLEELENLCHFCRLGQHNLCSYEVSGADVPEDATECRCRCPYEMP